VTDHDASPDDEELDYSQRGGIDNDNSVIPGREHRNPVTSSRHRIGSERAGNPYTLTGVMDSGPAPHVGFADEWDIPE
jgi:hypothetical protein